MVHKGAIHRQIVKLADEGDVDIIVVDAANPKISGSPCAKLAGNGPVTLPEK